MDIPVSSGAFGFAVSFGEGNFQPIHVKESGFSTIQKLVTGHDGSMGRLYIYIYYIYILYMYIIYITFKFGLFK